MEIFRSIKDNQAWADGIRAGKKTIGFVPTMGALHIAHVSLIKRAKDENDRVIVSIFVNPIQFGPNEDLSSYPGNFEDDMKLCESNGVDTVFYPESPEMYLKDHSTKISVSELTRSMCGEYRPGHFEGVATVVAKLFNIVKPHRAYFGQKDYQQYVVIERMVRDLNFDLGLIMCPIIRENDGLAVSSRNQYLTEAHRKQAVNIYRALTAAEKLIREGEEKAKRINKRLKDMISNKIPDSIIDYAGVYDAYNLKPVDIIGRVLVVAAAVRLGRARLIDNILVTAC